MTSTTPSRASVTRRLALAGAIALATLASMLLPAAASAQSGTLAFTSFRDGAPHIYTVAADGGALRRLTGSGRATFEWSPAYSPDGARIAYVCGNFELCVMNADGSAQTRLTTNDWPRVFRYDRLPAWSPDGTQIAFVRTDGGRDTVAIINADGSGFRPLAVRAGFNTGPVFSPDGLTIAFTHSADLGEGWTGSSEIHTIGVGGAGVRSLTDSELDASHPAWSPDGARIAFRDGSGDSGDIAVMNADGTGLRRVTKGASDDQDPTWSPDGSRITFASTRGRTHLLYHVPSAGGVATPVTTGRGPDMDPDWQPVLAGTGPAAITLPATPPSVVTPEARLVAMLPEAAYGIGVALAGNPLAGGAEGMVRAASNLQRLGRRTGAAARALRPSTSRGRELRRAVLASMRGAESVARDLRRAGLARQRHDRRANRRAAEALGGIVGVGFGLAQAGNIAGAPQGAI